jgi:23S rRNA (guanosine2251-2'-O)-methyltransferase
MAKVDASSIVAGMHAVDALLRASPAKVNHLVLQLGGKNPKLHELQRRAEEHGIRIHQLPKPRLDQWFPGPHQGVLAFCNTRAYDEWPAVRKELVAAKRAGYAPLIVVPAAMEDPRNLGACIRSAVALGADVVLAHNKGGAGLTPAVAKTAAGALESIAICQVNDIEKELKELRNEGYTIVGLEEDGEVEAHKGRYEGPLVLVVGGEDRGIPPHIRRACTYVVRLPMASGAHSYNASVALSLLLYEVNRSAKFERLATPRPKFFQDPQPPNAPGAAAAADAFEE